MKETTVIKFYNQLNNIKSEGLSISEYCKKNNIDPKSFYNKKTSLMKSSDNEMVRKTIELYNELACGNNKAKTQNVDNDDASEIQYIRDDNGKIKLYSYKIYIRNKQPLIGNLTREEMNNIYRLYSYYGSSLTQRQISRYFPDLSLVDFKRILRAFEITKAVCPFAPHMIEEKTEDELRDIQLREKENDFLRKAEEDMVRNNAKLLRKYAQENIELKKKLEDYSNFQVTINGDLKPLILEENSEEEVGQSINLYLADIHLGATVTSGTLYDENIDYGFDEAKRRLGEVIKKLYNMGDFDVLNIVLMGDNIDCCGIVNKTARLDHYIPENMDAREQANAYIELIDWFVESCVRNCMAHKINLYSVPCGNHSGDYEYICNKAIMTLVNKKYPNINTTLWDQFYGIFEFKDHVYIICHGKDAAYMKKGLPLVLNDKTQVQLYEFLEENNIHGKQIHVVKGDLHSNSYTSCKRFDYRNTLSLFGASDYSAMNFSANSYGVSYDLIIDNNITRGEFQNL